MEKIATILLRYWGHLLVLNSFVLVVTVVSAMTAPKTWTATTKLILPNTSAGLEASLGTLGSFRNADPGFSTEVNPLNVQVSILTSDVLMQRMLHQDPEKSKFPSVTQYAKLFSVKPQEQSTLILLTVSGSSQDLTLKRAIAMTKLYQERLTELRTTDRITRTQFSAQELQQAQQRLNAAQQALEEFKKGSGIVSINEQAQGLVTTLNSLIGVQAQAQAQAQSSAARSRTLAMRLGMTPDQAIRSLSLSENKEYQAVQRRLADLTPNLVELQSVYKDDFPRVQILLSQRQELQRRAQQLVSQAAKGTQSNRVVASGAEGRAALIPQLIIAESEASAQRRQAEQLQRQVEILSGTFRELPAKQGQLLELQRQYDVAEGIYKGLLAQVQQINIDPFHAYPNIQILDPPSVAAKPASKKLLTILNGLLASILGSIALVLFLERRNPHLAPSDLQQFKLPVLACIPHSRRLSHEMVFDADVEVVFQQLASLIRLKSLHERRLLITSASEVEGKTTIALGLAIALVDLGFRVLLVDADFRHAGLSARFGYTQDWLSGDAPCQIKPGLDLASALPRQKKVVDLITHGEFEQVLTNVQASQSYDYTLLDSASITLTSETTLMAADIDNVLFVTHSDISKRNPVQDSLHQLAQQKIHILGLVVNGVEMRAGASLHRLKATLENKGVSDAA